MKKLLLSMFLMVFLLSACKVQVPASSASSESAAEPESQASESTESSAEAGTYTLHAPSAEDQETPAESGETLAVLHVAGFGDISVKFFPQSAPKAVENFLTHAAEGYYNGVIFHRVMNDFMIQGGDPTGSGYYGESIWGDTFEDEFSDLVPIRGALCMANGGADTNGSQFFIVQTKETYADYLDQFGLSDAQKKLFTEHGGTPWLYQAHTVFGQVVEGMDVVDAIAAVETNSKDKPLKDVVIESIDIIQAP